ncbi:zinc transport system ATP-binding protein [Chitinivorax tropicus]|uniref:Zinc transport system ATP-binding protein n=1 Tax=Chitinivorax tropicus TaxID=714531 RepID=A0A840MNJ9_9PROT|nr:metal ABC transporter ATP-binding protein [Chitinivorax tropicus]MBB5018669.1 zinc transport system ATP-binding protein [Chitinivorax tropicus]
MTPAISAQDVCFQYGASTVLDKVCLDIHERDFIGIVGPNGGGKSTLLKMMLGLLQPDTGTISVLGQTPARAAQQIGYVPQYAGFARDFPITVEHVVLQGRLKPQRWFQRFNASDRRIAEQAMQETDVYTLRKRAVDALSGGQLQRVMIARALATEPKLLLLDEPTASIDMRAEKNIFDLLKQLNERLTIVVVSHDIGFISDYVNRIACLNRELICHDTAAIDAATLERIYGKHVHAIAHHHH